MNEPTTLPTNLLVDVADLPRHLDDPAFQHTVDASEVERFPAAALDAACDATLFGWEQSDQLSVQLSVQADRLVALATSQVGLGAGALGGLPLQRYVRWFEPTAGPQPWCAFFVSWCWDRATDADRSTAAAHPGSCESLITWARNHERLVSRPRRGDLYVYADLRHVGVVEHAGLRSFTSIDGDWGGVVARVIGRATDGPYLFLRP